MTTINFEHWVYEMTRDHHMQLIQEAKHQRLLRMVQPAPKRWTHWFQPLTFLRKGRLATRRLHWSGPVSEAPWN